jgi:hypothetical protein
VRSQNSPAVGGFPGCCPTAIGILNLVRPFARLGLTFQIFLPDIGFLFQLIRPIPTNPVNQSIAVGWNARHSPQEFCLLAELLHADHVLNVSYPIAPTLHGRLVGAKQVEGHVQDSANPPEPTWPRPLVIICTKGLIDIEIPADFPSGSTRTRGGTSSIKNAIGKIIGVVRCFAARANGVRRFTGDHPTARRQARVNFDLSVRQALATVAVLARDSRCDQGHDAVNREIVLRLTS